MILENLSVRNFRNHKSANFRFLTRITIFTGPNGTGKTSLLEAVALLGSARSFRNGKNEDFIRIGDIQATLSAKVQYQGLSNDLLLEIHPTGKRLYRNEKLLRKLQGSLPILPSIIFSPSDHRIVEGDASERKQFLNRAICNVDWEYAEALTKFNQVLAQRNKLLKSLSESMASLSRAQEQLDVWDEQFFSLGMKLVRARTAYLCELSKKVEAEYRRIAQKEERFQLHYCPFGELNLDEEVLHKTFTETLRDSLRRDLALGSTSVGPHKDEIMLTLQGNKVKFYGSQGERRTCALAMRLGEVSLFREKVGCAPILLIDDISSELDAQRRQSLMELLRQEDAQVLMTATELPTALMQDLEKDIVHWDLRKLGENENGHYGKNVQQLYSG